MNDQDPGNTELILPIVCSHCGKENSLAMNFALLAPDLTKNKEDDVIEEA